MNSFKIGNIGLYQTTQDLDIIFCCEIVDSGNRKMKILIKPLTEKEFDLEVCVCLNLYFS